MTVKERKRLQVLRKYYDVASSNLKKSEKAGKSLKDADKKAIDALNELNHQPSFDFDDEIEAIKAGANYKMVILSIAQKFRIYLRNHADFNTKHAINIIKRDLGKQDYTKNYDAHHLYQAYLESYYYLQPCGDVTTLRHDLVNGNYFNLKGDMKTIMSNREDLLGISHTGNIKKFLGKPEANSVKRHN